MDRGDRGAQACSGHGFKHSGRAMGEALAAARLGGARPELDLSPDIGLPWMRMLDRRGWIAGALTLRRQSREQKFPRRFARRPPAGITFTIRPAQVAVSVLGPTRLEVPGRPRGPLGEGRRGARADRRGQHHREYPSRAHMPMRASGNDQRRFTDQAVVEGQLYLAPGLRRNTCRGTRARERWDLPATSAQHPQLAAALHEDGPSARRPGAKAEQRSHGAPR
jgi:hypothetical protein